MFMKYIIGQKNKEISILLAHPLRVIPTFQSALLMKIIQKQSPTHNYWLLLQMLMVISRLAIMSAMVMVVPYQQNLH